MSSFQHLSVLFSIIGACLTLASSSAEMYAICIHNPEEEIKKSVKKKKTNVKRKGTVLAILCPLQ